jgi:hypothetical protein
MEKPKSSPEKNGISRGDFIKQSALATTALTIIPRHVMGGKGYVAPSDKLYIAAVGCGGEGAADIRTLMRTPNKNAVISHLCDVDDRQSAPIRKEFPKAP